MNTQKHPAVSLIPLRLLRPSPTNPRKDVDESALAGLAESVRQVGVLEPILIRSILSPGVDLSVEGFEIVAGHRRVQAARAAGLEAIPAMILELTNDEALEVQSIENLQREDLSEIEEAEGFAALKERGRSVEEIAAKVGKSKGTIYARLKLLELPESARAALKAGKLEASIALLIARIPDPALQKKATKDVLGNRGLEGWSYRQASEHFQRNYMLALKGAPFPVGDPDLLPSAGACTDCPHRTGNAKDLFGDVPSADVCTLPFCYEAKKAAAAARTIEEAKASGLRVLTAKESAAIFLPYSGERVAHNAIYIDPKDACEADPKRRHWGSLLGKDAPEAVIAIDREGRARRLLPRKEAQKALREKYDWAKPQKRDAGAGEKPKVSREKELKLAILRAQMGEIIAAIERPLGDQLDEREFWGILANGTLAQGANQDPATICARRGIACDDRGYRKKKGAPGLPSAEEALGLLIPEMSVDQLRALVFELMFGQEYAPINLRDFVIGRVVSVAGIDLEAIEKRVRKEFTEREKAEAKTSVPTPKIRKPRKTEDANPRARACVYCGCTEVNACEGGCSWIETEDGSDVCNSPSCLAQYDGLDPDVVRNMSGAKDPARSGKKKAAKKVKKTRAPKPKKASKRAAGKKASR